MEARMHKAAIIGAAGYTGAELTRLLLAHPGFSVETVTSTSDAGRSVSDLYPAMAGADMVYVEPDASAIAATCDVAFLAVPHTAALAIAPALVEAGLLVVDLSADYRLSDTATYETWYGVEHTSAYLLGGAAYGLPELWRDSIGPATSLIACPGCYPTATLVAIAPALGAGIVSGPIVVDAKSGVSGAGRGLSEATHFPSANESLEPYSVGKHRHTPEIAQGLARIAGTPVGLTFVPHLAPMTRGLLSTVYAPIAAETDAARIHAAYTEMYADEPFVTVHPVGRMPATKEVTGSNRAHVGIAVDGGSGILVAACAIDNLVKGAAGQAVQCANIRLGLDEVAGLDFPGLVV